MLINLFRNYSENPRMALIAILLIVPSILIALTVHEYCHGRMALALGDKTALMTGRLSLNPIQHLDPIGALMMLLFGFGFAKPVPVNMRNVSRVNYKLGTILISLAGPVSNILLAFFGVFGLLITETVFSHYGADLNQNLLIIIYLFFEYFSFLNIGLAVFNLIPLPPLDGSRVLTVFLPVKAQMWFHKYEQVIQIIIFAMLWFGALDNVLDYSRNYIFYGMYRIISFLPFIN